MTEKEKLISQIKQKLNKRQPYLAVADYKRKWLPKTNFTIDVPDGRETKDRIVKFIEKNSSGNYKIGWLSGYYEQSLTWEAYADISRFKLTELKKIKELF